MTESLIINLQPNKWVTEAVLVAITHLQQFAAAGAYSDMQQNAYFH